MTTESTRKPKTEPTPDDHLLCEVDVTRGRAIFWDGEQREGRLHDVPKSLALQWLAAGHAAAVYEPK